MKLQHSCTIHAPLAAVWELTADLAALAPCLPGASAVKVDADNYDTTMKLRLGPMDMLFRGKVAIAERDVAAGRIVLTAKASEARGQGNASATTTIALAPSGAVTMAMIDTDLVINGRMAQMGRGIIGEVSNDLVTRFVDNLDRLLATRSPAATAAAEAADPARPSAAQAAAEPAAIAGEKRDGVAHSSPAPEQSLNVFALLARIVRRRIAMLFGVSARG